MPAPDSDIILQAYCAGEITWREAASRLGLTGIASFEAALKNAGLTWYEPDEKASEEKMVAINALLDDDV